MMGWDAWALTWFGVSSAVVVKKSLHLSEYYAPLRFADPLAFQVLSLLPWCGSLALCTARGCGTCFWAKEDPIVHFHHCCTRRIEGKISVSVEKEAGGAVLLTRRCM